jgi:hypothetical protein
MSCRSHATKPAIALWVLVALADLALLVATVGVLTVVLAVAGAAVVAAAVVRLWMMGHRPRAAAMPGPSRLRRRA